MAELAKVGDTITVQHVDYIVEMVDDADGMPNTRREHDRYNIAQSLYVRRPRGHQLFIVNQFKTGDIQSSVTKLTGVYL